MVNNGFFSYDYEWDGWFIELGGCIVIVCNFYYDIFLVICYVKRYLMIMMDIDGKYEWRDCIEVFGVCLFCGYYFGIFFIIGDFLDNYDVIFLKLFELIVERILEEEKFY